MKIKVKERLKRFAYETFRPRTKADYAEIFTRGSGGEGKTPYPWFYSRVLLVCLLLFAVFCIGYSVSELNFPAVAFVGGIFADLTFVVLLFEIYPKKDLPLFVPLALIFAGGVISSAIIYAVYGIQNVREEFVSQAWTAFVEETGKALAIIILLIILKKRNPFFCFIVGAAVGGGYSAFENTWYMFTDGLAYANGLSDAMLTALIRALGTPFSHAAWAAAFGWAISGKKPWKKWQPYAVYAFTYTMHFFVNFPLMNNFKNWGGYSISAATGILSITLMIYLVIKCKREVCPKHQYGVGEAEESSTGRLFEISSFETYETHRLSGLERKKFIANVLAACAVLSFTIMLMGPTCVFGGYVNLSYHYYDTFEEARTIAQSGNEFIPDFSRQYIEYDNYEDFVEKNYSFTYMEGELHSVTQREQYGEYFYRFYYGYTQYQIIYLSSDDKYYIIVYVNGSIMYSEIDLSEGFDKDDIIYAEDKVTPVAVRIWKLQGVDLEFQDTLYAYRIVAIGGGAQVELNSRNYFNVNQSCYGVYYSADGKYYTLMRERAFVRGTESVVFTSVFAAVFVGFGTAYLISKIKIRRHKDVE